MSDALSTAAAVLGLPEALVQRSAEARSAETGTSVEDILTAWAGGDPMGAPAEAAQPLPVQADTIRDDLPTEPEAATGAPVAVAAPAPVPTAGGRAPIPAQVTAAEASHLPDVITVPTAGIRERTNFSMPRWLTTVLIVGPLFALFALGGSATGECGEATELMTDVVSGKIVNCDGSEFTGQAVGGGGPDYLAMGEAIYRGTGVTGVNCAGCHGANGQGAGNFPALTGVMTTFGACSDHVEWVALGSAGFAGGTYGDTAKPVAMGMPSFESSLTPDQIAAVAAFERVRHGGGDPDTVLADCGLGPESVAGDETATESEAGAEDRSALAG